MAYTIWRIFMKKYARVKYGLATPRALPERNLTFHKSCRKEYTKSNNVASCRKHVEAASLASQLISPKKKKLRSSNTDTSVQFKCIFCLDFIGSIASFNKKEKRKPTVRRRTAHKVSTIKIKDTIMTAANSRNDNYGKSVSVRLGTLNDLVAADAMYHGDCYKNFMKIKPRINPVGRPCDNRVDVAMQQIFAHIENNEECQYSMNDLIKLVNGYCPSRKWIRKKLEEKYGESMVITENNTKQTIICFKSFGDKIISDNWYNERKQNIEEERCRIVNAAAEIIREDIRAKHYEISSYPSTTNFFNNVEDDIPPTLKAFLAGVIKFNRKCEPKTLDRKCDSIAHAIISATRPRSYISPIQLATAVYIHRKFESKLLLDLLSALQLCSSYNEVVLFEDSSLAQKYETTNDRGFLQFSFDNADFNCNTLDGLNSIHMMGGVEMVTPPGRFSDHPIPKLKKHLTRSEISTLAKIDIYTFNKTNRGVSSVLVQDLDEFRFDENPILPSSSDILWMCSRMSPVSKVGGWNGFMMQLTKSLPYETSSISFLPFINLPPSEYDTILTSLHEALKRSRRIGQETTVVTFDQPLYYKAKEIITSAKPTDPISKIVVRLGGFHTLMSFLGCIGYVMGGSGLKEILSLIYAPKSVEKMLNGHAYSRSVRGHFLVHEALSRLILQKSELFAEETEYFNANSIDTVLQENSTIEGVKNKVIICMEKLKKFSPTAELWVQYFEMVNIVYNFIEAERMGDWLLHLSCIKTMIPFFKACNHYLYAKSTHLYLQEMVSLKKTMKSEDYQSFTTGGFTIRRSEKFWSGTWSDMVIEQTLMRSTKSVGGLIHGRSWTENVMNRWILAMPACSLVTEKLEVHCEVQYVGGEQHTDYTEARIIRDKLDVDKILSFFENHPPFFESSSLISLSSGIVADKSINCHHAYECGYAAVKKTVGMKFSEIKGKKADAVLPLSKMSSVIKINEKSVIVDPLLLFQRISLLKKSDDELRKYFEYELAPFPLSLFDEDGMRKNQKSDLYSIFEKNTLEINGDPFYVIDGGFLIHRVLWKKKSTVNEIITAYTSYVERSYGNNVYIVFDGYDPSDIKNFERNRRYQGEQIEVKEMCLDTIIELKPQDFFSSSQNKISFIKLLMTAFILKGVLVKQAPGDADSLIVNTAIDVSKIKTSHTITVVGQDIDLMVLLCALTPSSCKIFFSKPEKDGNPPTLYSITDNQDKNRKENILFIHAASGCDTTSAIFQKGKNTAKKIFQKNDFTDIVEAFHNKESSKEEIFEQGLKFIIALYGGDFSLTLNDLRYDSFSKNVARNKTIKLASLPPTEEAARQHLYRIYLQIQHWQGYYHDPAEWGWQLNGDKYEPKFTDKSPAPEELLKSIFCNCKKGCMAGCTCRKHGLKCSRACGTCVGESCFNACMQEDSDEDVDGDLESEETTN